MNNSSLPGWEAIPRRVKVPQAIARRIRGQILSGTLRSGSKLPSEQELISAMGVSRQTLREGLRILESQGLLNIRAGQNGGAFVAEAPQEMACIGLVNFLHNKQLTMEHLIEVRMLIEPYLVAKAAPLISDEEIASLEELQQRGRLEIRNNEFNKVRDVEIAFHNQLAVIAGNPLLSFINAFISHLLKGLKQGLKPDESFSLTVATTHDNILEALKRRDPNAAREAIILDIEIVMKALAKLAENQGLLNWKLIAE